MAFKFTRRGMIAATSGTAAAGLAGKGLETTEAQAQVDPAKPYNPGRSEYWYPSPNPRKKKDLRTGPMTVRLGGSISQAGVDAAKAALDNPEPILQPIQLRSPFDPRNPRPAPAPPPDLSQTVDFMTKLVSYGVTAARVNSTLWSALSDSDLAQLKAKMKELDFEFVEFGTYLNPMHSDPAIRNADIKICIEHVEACEKVGTRCIGITAGSRHEATMNQGNNFATDPLNWTLESWKMSVDYCKQIIKATPGYKTTIGIEANVTSILDTPLAHKNYIEDIGSPERVSVVFDPSNSIHLLNYYYTTEMLEECFDMWGEKINNLHGKDVYIEPAMQAEFVRQVTPGLGVMDYETLLARLSRLKWARSITPEIANSEWPACYSHIRKIAKKVGVKIHKDVV